MKDKPKIGIVTAASKGIGAACARKLNNAGYKLVVMSRTEDIFSLADELDARPIQGAIEKKEDLERLIQFTFEKYGDIDSVIINSGHPPKGDLLELSDDDWIQGMNLVLLNTIRICRIVTPIMNKKGSGAIVNISAFGAKEPSLKFPISSVMRSALGSFTKLYANQVGFHNIRMNNILPGMISTYPIDQETLHTIPMQRQGEPEEVADLALFLTSESSSYITGQSFLIDGGMVKSF